MASSLFRRFGVSRYMRGNPFRVKPDSAHCTLVAAYCKGIFLGNIKGDSPVAPPKYELLLAYSDGDPGLAFAVMPKGTMEERVAELELELNRLEIGTWKVAPDLHYLLVRFNGMILDNGPLIEAIDPERPVMVLATNYETGESLRFAFPSQVEASEFAEWARHPIFARTGQWFQMTFMAPPRAALGEPRSLSV